MTREQEVKIFKRIENAELNARETLWRAAIVGGYLSTIGTKVLGGEERLERVVALKGTESADRYLQSLPGLIAAVRRAEAAVARSWVEYQRVRSVVRRKKTLALYRRRVAGLRALFPKFNFNLKVYEEYLEQQRPRVVEIESFYRHLESARNPTRKSDTSIGRSVLERRLRQMGRIQRMAPRKLAGIVRKAERFIREAQKAKTELVEANMGIVVPITKGYTTMGLPFLNLVAEGNTGLVEAVETFESRYGNSFAAYAAKRVWQAMAIAHWRACRRTFKASLPEP
ncbi:MAG: sigma factor [Opitutaceae bacterium]